MPPRVVSLERELLSSPGRKKLHVVQPKHPPRAVLRDFHLSLARRTWLFEYQRRRRNPEVVVIPGFRDGSQRPAAFVIRGLCYYFVGVDVFGRDQRETSTQNGMPKRHALCVGLGSDLATDGAAQGGEFGTGVVVVAGEEENAAPRFHGFSGIAERVEHVLIVVIVRGVGTLFIV